MKRKVEVLKVERNYNLTALGFVVMLSRFMNRGVTPGITNMPSAFE